MSLQGLLRNINFEIKDNELNKFKELDHNIRHAYFTQTIYILYQLKQFWRMQVIIIIINLINNFVLTFETINYNFKFIN